MVAAAPIFSKPPSFLELKTRRPISSSDFPTTKLLFSGKFVSRKSVSWDNRAWSPNTNTMAELMKTGVCRGRNSDEFVGAIEQEAFVDGSSESRPNFIVDGLGSLFNYLSKWIVAAFFGAVILWRHDAEALWAALGSVLNAWLSITLKQILNQERPVSTMRSDPGMPSSHAQSIFYAIVFTILSIVEWLGVNGLAITLSGLVIALGSYLSWLRVSQQFHTINQVVVGTVVGSIFGILWFWSWNAVVLGAFISHLWVRIIVVLGAAVFCLGFLVYLIRYWIMDENGTL